MYMNDAFLPTSTLCESKEKCFVYNIIFFSLVAKVQMCDIYYDK